MHVTLGRHIQIVWWGWTRWRLIRWRFPRADMVMADGSLAGPIFHGFVLGPVELRYWPEPMPASLIRKASGPSAGAGEKEK